MAEKKTILVACGTAIATSAIVAKAIEEALRESGLDVNIRHCRASDVPALSQQADLVVTTTPVTTTRNIPVIQTLAFLTGVGKEGVIDQIIEKLTD